MSKETDKPELPGTGIRVLIVDDDEAHAQAVAESLERVGYECTVAGSGEKGLSLIEKETYDVVVTDLRMGEIDGLTLLRRTKEELPDAEVILLTGHASVQSALAAGQAGTKRGTGETAQ
ncbi:MAG: sigma-54 factor interaction domain-containing protein [Planctomycetota bacterium]|nr:MAG: sigma-54 factor interaction domain-containing protein [Planctomycetota bacterium]